MVAMTHNFLPPFYLRGPGIQTTLSSLRPRKMLARRRAAAMLACSQDVILDCGDGVRLLGAASLQADAAESRGMVILIHGWEGSIDSGYILSAGGQLFACGYSVFRLNLRDHGHSHHLNREFFASTRLDEVANAVTAVQAQFPHRYNYLSGFSLGGNFVLRIALRASRKMEEQTQGRSAMASASRLTGILAVCPLIEPLAATRRLQQNHPVYHRYFVRKWKRSLALKLQLFPDLDDAAKLLGLNNLAALHNHFVPRHTEYPSMEAYLNAYRIDPRDLACVTIPTHILAAADDPITEVRYVDRLSPTRQLSIEKTDFGGHCGFLENLSLTSWTDQRMPQIFADQRTRAEFLN